MTEGWDSLSPAENEQPQANKLDILYAKTFSSPEGQKVLEHLREVTIEQPSWQPGEDASFGHAREGMCNLVRYIEKRIRRSENG
tara:strand:+ start:591 stop:842 length:252 start_codon:yes stop_codon:yes gene_type:complete